jgi:hypothetical protein
MTEPLTREQLEAAGDYGLAEYLLMRDTALAYLDAKEQAREEVDHWRVKAECYGAIVHGCTPALERAGIRVDIHGSGGAGIGIAGAVERIAARAEQAERERDLMDNIAKVLRASVDRERARADRAEAESGAMREALARRVRDGSGCVRQPLAADGEAVMAGGNLSSGNPWFALVAPLAERAAAPVEASDCVAMIVGDVAALCGENPGAPMFVPEMVARGLKAAYERGWREAREAAAVEADGAARAGEHCQKDGGCRHVPCLVSRQISSAIRALTPSEGETTP